MSKFMLRALCVVTLAVSNGALSGPITIVHAGHLITEPGKPILEQQSLIIENGRIKSIEEGYAAGDQVVDLSTAWVMPGLIDMHAHISTSMDLT